MGEILPKILGGGDKFENSIYYLNFDRERQNFFPIKKEIYLWEIKLNFKKKKELIIYFRMEIFN